MRTVVYSLSALCLVAIGLYSAFAKPPVARDQPAHSNTRFDFNEPALQLSPFAPEPTSPETQRLQQHTADYVQLADQYAKLLNEDELAAETQELERKLSIKRSAISLESVRQQLNEIIEKFPSTPSAEKAQQLLNGLNAPADAPDEGGADAVESGPEEGANGFETTPDEAQLFRRS